jgi:hypothetical protein
VTQTEYHMRRRLGQIPNGTKVIVLRWKFKTSQNEWYEYFVQGTYPFDTKEYRLAEFKHAMGMDIPNGLAEALGEYEQGVEVTL